MKDLTVGWALDKPTVGQVTVGQATVGHARHLDMQDIWTSYYIIGSFGQAEIFYKFRFFLQILEKISIFLNCFFSNFIIFFKNLHKHFFSIFFSKFTI